MPQKENKLILYKDEEGKVRVNTRFADEDMWLTQALLAETYNTAQQNISLHQKGIYADGELDEAATHKKYLLVRQEGKRQVQREIGHYNLDMVIALGYRVRVAYRRASAVARHSGIQKIGGRKNLTPYSHDFRATSRHLSQSISIFLTKKRCVLS